MAPMPVTLIWAMKRQYWPATEILGLPYLLLTTQRCWLLWYSFMPQARLPSLQLSWGPGSWSVTYHGSPIPGGQSLPGNLFFIHVSATLFFFSIIIIKGQKIHMYWVNLRKFTPCYLFPRTDVSLFYLQLRNSVIRWLAFITYLIVEDMTSFIPDFSQKWADRAPGGCCEGKREGAVLVETTPGLQRGTPVPSTYISELSARPDEPSGQP